MEGKVAQTYLRANFPGSNRDEFSVSRSSDTRVLPCFTVSIHPMGFGLLIQCTDVMMPTLHMVFITVINSISFLRGFPDI